MRRWIPILITAVLAIWVASSFRTPKDSGGQIATHEFGRLPVVSNGRFQPLESLARNSLLQLVEKQSVKIEPWESRSKKLTATEWLMEMTMNQPLADTRPVFRIDHPDLKGLLGVPMEKDRAAKSDGKHYTWLQIQPKLRELQEESRRAAAKDQAKRNPFERAVLRLMNGVALYMKLQNLVQPQNASDWLAEYQSYLAAIEPGRTAAIAQNAGRDYDKDALERLMRDLQRFDVMMSIEPALPVPPHHPERDRDSWMRMGEALMEIARGEPPHFSVEAYAKMASAYRAGDAAAFNDAVRKYRIALGTEFTPELGKARWEQVFNNLQPFYKGMVIFTLAGLLGGAFWIRPGQWDLLRRTAFWLCILGLAVHTIGLIFRMALEGRPPVTNLYSSAIFIGWGAVILGLILEGFWKNAIGIVIAAVCAFLTLIIAHHLSLSGDTMEMMRAVLDTNFWLATHVVIITLGYSAAFVAGFLGIVFILRGFFTSHLDAATAKGLTKMVYGIICFATLFSFVGTVLGGIWADQSWGRFWGWDPKENGALMIVLWNALILHARWGGLIRERGLMNCAIFGNVITAWSWFGVNMLGIGLHSYGFMDAAFKWLLLFAATQVALIVLGCIPLSMWRSFRDQTPPTSGGEQPAPLPVPSAAK